MSIPSRGEGRARIELPDIRLSARPGRTSETDRAVVRVCPFRHAHYSRLNWTRSHSGGKGIFDMKSSLMTFVPLSAISPDAQTLQEKYLASIRARIDIGDCPPGLQKQYKLQLEHIEAQIPSHEMTVMQSIGFAVGKRDGFGDRRTLLSQY